MRVAGADGTKGGWVAIVLEEGRVSADHGFRPIETSFDQLGDVSVLGIDVPIGFGPRRADAAARAFLTGAASTRLHHAVTSRSATVKGQLARHMRSRSA